jgi:hypothetical protein
MSNTDPTKNTTQKTKKMSNTDPTKNRGWVQALIKGNLDTSSSINFIINKLFMYKIDTDLASYYYFLWR